MTGAPAPGPTGHGPVPTLPPTRATEVLTDGECRTLLATATIGRLGYSDGALPAIVPVAFTLDGNEVVIPAREGDDLVRAVRGAVVAFTVDSFDALTGVGWGVTVVGPARVTAAASDGTAPDVVRSRAPAPPRGERCIHIRTGMLRGWRVPPPPADGAT